MQFASSSIFLDVFNFLMSVLLFFYYMVCLHTPVCLPPPVLWELGNGISLSVLLMMLNFPQVFGNFLSPNPPPLLVGVLSSFVVCLLFCFRDGDIFL